MVIGEVLTVDELMNDYGFEGNLYRFRRGLPALWASPARHEKGRLLCSTVHDPREPDESLTSPAAAPPS